MVKILKVIWNVFRHGGDYWTRVYGDVKREGHPYRTLKRKLICNTLGVRPERWAYKKYLKFPLLNVGCGRDYIKGATNIDNLQVKTYTDYEVTPDIECDATNIPVPGSSFQTVLASHVFEHQISPWAFQAEMRRVLRKGGILILVVPNYTYMGHEAYHRDPTHVIECTESLVDHFKNTWDVVQFNKLGKWYGFSIDIILRKR